MKLRVEVTAEDIANGLGDVGAGFRWPLPNVHLGVSVEDEPTARERIPWLLGSPATVRWVSYEPALAGVDFTRIRLLNGDWPHADLNALTGHVEGPDDILPAKLDWIVVGGESGPGARPFDIAWARSTVEQCRAAAVPVFIKQLGAFPYHRDDGAGWAYDAIAGGDRHWRWDERRDRTDGSPELHIFEQRDKKGGDPNEWPEDLRVREFPGGAP